MQKVMYGVSGVLFLALCFISWRYVEAIKDLENESYKNVLLESKLDTQNKAIEKLKLDTQKYKEDKDKQIQAVQEKYKKALNNTQKVYINTCDIKEFQHLKNQEAQLQQLIKARYKGG